MGKKGKKTRWRRLPIGSEQESGLSLESASAADTRRITFNEDEYTKITTPRQDVLFKKGYFGRKRTTTTNPTPSETQEVHSVDSVESGETYVSEEPQYVFPAGYVDPNGVYYVNAGNAFETYDPYTGAVTVVVGPPPQYPGAPVLAALPCQPVPLQPLEWFNPPAPSPSWCYSYNRKKRYSTDSQNCSAQSSESTGPPGSPQEPADEVAGACAPPNAIYHHQPPYVYPGYMFGPPIYNMNGVTMQGVIPQHVQLPPDLSTTKRRKKRRRRRRGGLTDDGSESSCCEEPLMCDVASCHDPSETSSDAVCQSGASSDAGAGPASDSGINTDPTPNSGSNSPPLHTNDHQFGGSDSVPPGFEVCSNDAVEDTIRLETEPSLTSLNAEPMQDPCMGSYSNESLQGPCLTSHNYEMMQYPCQTSLDYESVQEPCQTSYNDESMQDPCQTSYNDESMQDPCQTSYNVDSMQDPCQTSYNDESLQDPCQTSYNDESMQDPCQTSYNDESTQDPCQTSYNDESTQDPCQTNHIDESLQDEYSEDLSTAEEEDMTPNLCLAAPEFSSQESTLSCMSTPSASRDLVINQPEISILDLSQEEFEFESCRSLPEPGPVEECQIEVSFADDTVSESLETFSSNQVIVHESPVNGAMLNGICDKSDVESHDFPTKNNINLDDDDLDNSELTKGDIENEIVNDFFEDSIQDSIASLKVSFDVMDLDITSNKEKELTTKEEFLNQHEYTPSALLQPVQEPEYCATIEEAIESVQIPPLEETSDHRFTNDETHSLPPEVPPCKHLLPPVPPPRRKKSLSKAVDKLASKVVEDAIKQGVEEAVEARLKNTLSITEAVTRWLNSQGSSPLTVPFEDYEFSDEEVEEEGSLTDQKNVRGNPFLAPSHSGAGQRVAKDNESVDSSASALEWDLWDHSLCDPSRSVDKYYRLGADDAGDRVPPSIYKTAMHIRHTGPFPCGVCCIIQ